MLQLELVLEWTETAWLKVNLEKCSLVQPEVPLMGHMVSGEGVRQDLRILQAIQDFQPPTTIRQIWSFWILLDTTSDL